MQSVELKGTFGNQWNFSKNIFSGNEIFVSNIFRLNELLTYEYFFLFFKSTIKINSKMESANNIQTSVHDARVVVSVEELGNNLRRLRVSLIDMQTNAVIEVSERIINENYETISQTTYGNTNRR